jgi:hypothetical protein
MRNRHFSILGAGGAIAILMTLALTTTRTRADEDDHDPRISRGIQINPVHLNLVGKNPRRVYLGSYFVNGTSACNDSIPFTRG